MTVPTPISWYRYTRMVSDEDSVRNLEARPTLSYTRMGAFTVRCIRRVRHTWRLNFRRRTPREARLHFHIHEWAHYRYGVFDEYGTRGDSISGDLLLGRNEAGRRRKGDKERRRGEGLAWISMLVLAHSCEWLSLLREVHR
ncbi:uncharacterized protein [Dermacentor albipictus]|uniref:uncharacterized protein isoform X3 n=1 Tax=Dermacentor albipictus TaxID=60249 RepID=UPI0031FD8D90